MKRYPITVAGFERLKTELAGLKAERPKVAEAIEVARAHGDLSENADYDAAREKAGMLEARIRDLENMSATAEPIDPAKLTNLSRVTFGTRVTLSDVDSGKESSYGIVGVYEVNVAAGLISIESPLARGLINREVGQETEVVLPGGTKTYEILDIKPLISK